MTEDLMNSGKFANPGSEEAQEAGCICPVLDNNRGKGTPHQTESLFWWNWSCPYHFPREEKK